jgi:hypothetical protein
MATVIGNGLPSAGLFAGPTAWAISTQANYALVPWVCAHKLPVIPVVAALLVALSLFGGFLSWRAFSNAAPAPQNESEGGRPHRFVAVMGVMMAALFAVIIVMQGAAGIMFEGCER